MKHSRTYERALWVGFILGIINFIMCLVFISGPFIPGGVVEKVRYFLHTINIDFILYAFTIISALSFISMIIGLVKQLPYKYLIVVGSIADIITIIIIYLLQLA